MCKYENGVYVLFVCFGGPRQSWQKLSKVDVNIHVRACMGLPGFVEEERIEETNIQTKRINCGSCIFCSQMYFLRHVWWLIMTLRYWPIAFQIIELGIFCQKRHGHRPYLLGLICKWNFNIQIRIYEFVLWSFYSMFNFFIGASSRNYWT